MHANGVYMNGKWTLVGELAKTEVAQRVLAKELREFEREVVS